MFVCDVYIWSNPKSMSMFWCLLFAIHMSRLLSNSVKGKTSNSNNNTDKLTQAIHNIIIIFITLFMMSYIVQKKQKYIVG